jgi:hypothetical protein
MHDEASLDKKGRFVLHDEQRQSDGLGDVSISCPKCASRHGSMLESVHEQGSSKLAAPPHTMEVKGWLFLAVGSALALIALHPGMTWRGGAFAALATGAAAMGSWAALFNIRRLPVLRDRWERSVMCSRCGHVFMDPDVTLAGREGS